MKFLMSLFTHRNRRVRQLRVRIAMLLAAFLTPGQMLSVSGLPRMAGGDYTLNDLYEKRANIITQMNALNDAALAEGRELTAEEENNHTRMFEEQSKLKKQIDRLEEARELQRGEAERAARHRDDRNGGGANPSGGNGGNGEERTLEQRAEARHLEFRKWMNQPEPTNGSWEFRALQADSDAAGGYTVVGETFVGGLIKAVDDNVFVRRLATKHQVTSSESLGRPSLDADPADADWTAEIQTGSEDSTMAFGKRTLTPHPLAKRIKVSRKLLRLSALGAEALVTQRLAYKFGITEEKAFLTGSGANQPLGVFTATADGVPTSRDSLTGSATSITADGLFDAKYALKGNYWPRARWAFHRDGMKIIAKLKDSQNRYLWEPSLQAGQPESLLNFPVEMSEYVPNTFTTGLYVGMLADWSFYEIADSLDFDLQRLVELYAETNQIGFIGRQEIDGMPVLAEAFVRLKTN